MPQQVQNASQEVVEGFRLIYGALSRNDRDTWLESIHDEAELHQSPEVPGTAGTFHGRAGASRLIDEVSESFGEVDWKIEHVYELGPARYLVLLRPKGRATASGLELEAEIGHLIELRDGKTYRFYTYIGWDKARAAAGLPAE